MPRKRKKRSRLCLIQGTTLLETSHSRNALERSKKRFKEYTSTEHENMDIVTEEELTERLQRQNIEARQRQDLDRRLREQQNFAYQNALEKDRQEEEKKQQKLMLKNSPEARARLFDTLFKKKNPHYKAYLKRIKN